jgi:hypothetical protein
MAREGFDLSGGLAPERSGRVSYARALRDSVEMESFKTEKGCLSVTFPYLTMLTSCLERDSALNEN